MRDSPASYSSDREQRRSGPDRGREPRRALGSGLPRAPGRSVPGRRAPRRDRDPPARGARQPAHDGDLSRGRASSRRSRRRPRASSSRTARSCRSRAWAAKSSTGTSGTSTRASRTSAPRPAALHHPDRPGAGPAREGQALGRTRCSTPSEVVASRAGRRRRDGPRSGRGTAATSGPSARVPRRRRRRAQPDPAAARDRDARPRELLGQHHDLLPRRCPRAARRPQPERDLRLPSAARRLLPLLDRRRRRLPRRQRDDRRGRQSLDGDRRGHERGDMHPRTSAGRSERPTCPSRSRTSSAGRRRADWAERLPRAASSSPATPRT